MSEPVGTQVGGFPVELPVFTGPFRVLAELLLNGKVDVCDVRVATVTDRFLARAQEAEGWTLEEATWFLAVGAALLEMKVGRLMPKHREPDEEDLIGGSPDLAYARSLELRAFRRVAGWVAERLETWSKLHPREVGPAEEFADLYPDLMEKVTASGLAEAAAALLRSPTVDLTHVQPIRASVTEALEALSERLTAGRREPARFRELVADCREPIQVVVRFLALLELYKDGRVALSQAETFGEIEVRWEG
ncbi:MAG TPA: segregation/condensation protein A [Actinomycetota bacterium]|nr:segregation/condensation protein A [Actinomycetota bacterium]